MRRSSWLITAMVLGLSASATPAFAQTDVEAAAQPAAQAEPAAQPDEAAAEPATDPAPEATAQPAVEQATPAPAPATPLLHRTVSDLAGSVLGTHGAQRVQDAQTVIGAVSKGRAAVSGTTPASGDDVSSAVRGLIGLFGKKKPAATPQP